MKRAAEKGWVILVSSRWVLALLPALLTAWLTSGWFPAYRAGLVNSGNAVGGGLLAYADLDSDGYSEFVQTGDFTEAYRFVTIKDYRNQLINEWDFPGRGIDPERPYLLGDYDRNGYLEFYVVTCKHDSLFLGTCEPLNHGNTRLRVIHLANSLPGLESYGYSFYPGAVTDLNGDGYGEAVFAVTGGFCKQPRQVFAWDVRNDTLLRSPLSAAAITGIRLFDLLGDSLPEILLTTYATGNCRKDEFPYHDSSSWLMVLDRQLQFCFDPVEFQGRAGLTVPVPVRFGGRPSLVMERTIYSREFQRMELNLVSPQGEILLTKSLPGLTLIPATMSFPDHRHERLFLLSHRAREIHELDRNFDTIRTFDMGCPGFEKDFTFFDIDGNGSTELLARVNDGNTLAVIGNNLKTNALLPVPFNTYRPLLSLRKHGDHPPTFAINDGKTFLEFRYRKNPWHLLQIPWYLLAYAGWSYLILLIQHLGRIRLQRQIRLKTRITEMQALLLQNQLNPHFILNALNSVNASITLDRKAEALEKMKHFTELVRASLLDASRLERSLSEELMFVTHYLEVERSKMEFPFEYRLDIGPGVDESAGVPKMILHTFVENSIKHGLRPLNRTGLLTITITREGPGYFFICIADNGVGRSRAMKTSSLSSTGKGQQVISELIDLHNAMKKHPITWEIRDLTGEDGQPAGTAVEVKMPVGGE